MKSRSLKLVTSLRDNKISAIKFYSSKINKLNFLPIISRFINKYLYRIGLGTSINRYENSFTIYSAFADKKLYYNYKKSSKFICFGSGAFYHNRWTNYDYPGRSLYYKNIQGNEFEDFQPINLCDKNLVLPEKNNSIELIYCSHTLEHIEEKSSKHFMKECFRILKKGGLLRVALPNTKNNFYILQLVKQQNNLDKIIKQNYLQDAVSHIFSDMKNMSLDYSTSMVKKSKYNSSLFSKNSIIKHPEISKFNNNQPERHIAYWDLENLAEIIKKIGFKFIIPNYQGNSVGYPFRNLHVFDNTEQHMSIYADIIK